MMDPDSFEDTHRRLSRLEAAVFSPICARMRADCGAGPETVAGMRGIRMASGALSFYAAWFLVQPPVTPKLE